MINPQFDDDGPPTDELRGDPSRLESTTDDPEGGIKLAYAVRGHLLSLAERTLGPAFHRFRWPLSSAFEFDVAIATDALVVIWLRDRGGESMVVGPGRIHKPFESKALPPRSPDQWMQWHDALRRTLNLDSRGAVFVIPIRAPKPDNRSPHPPQSTIDSTFWNFQVGANLIHHCRALGLPPPRLEGAAKEPRPGSAEHRLLQRLRKSRHQFIGLPADSTTVTRLRKYGFQIESARQARSAGKEVSSSAKGWRLLS